MSVYVRMKLLYNAGLDLSIRKSLEKGGCCCCCDICWPLFCFFFL